MEGRGGKNKKEGEGRLGINHGRWWVSWWECASHCIEVVK